MKLLTSLVLALSGTTLSAFAEEHTIEQKEKTFSKVEMTVKAGDTIVFKNSDTVAHNVFSSSAQNAFSVPIQNVGGSSPVVFKQEGVTEVRCAIHPKMKIIVTVTK